MTEHRNPFQCQYSRSLTFALAGQPNVGKSTVFNMLTGLTQHVGNWPGKTVEFKSGQLILNDTLIHLVDLPGVYSLTANSDEERITRDFIIREKPDVVVVIVNAALLERNLYLVAELIPLKVPFVLGLNMLDVANQQGFKIEVNVLQAALGVPVVPIIAPKNQGLKELMQAAISLADSPDSFHPSSPEIRPGHRPVLEKIQTILRGRLSVSSSEKWTSSAHFRAGGGLKGEETPLTVHEKRPLSSHPRINPHVRRREFWSLHPRKEDIHRPVHAIYPHRRVGSGIPYDEDWVALKLLEGDGEITEFVQQTAPSVWAEIQPLLLEHEDAILDIIGGRYEWISRMVRAAIVRPKAGTVVLTDRLDRFATHPFWGLVLLFSVLGLVFWLTYNVASPIVDWLNTGVMTPLANLIAGALAGSPGWVSGLIVDGIIGGAGTVLTFLPILVIFFAILGLLEDVGYLTRAAYVMDRYMHWMGLHGRSFLPLFLGFGCNVPAVMGTRIIENRRARLLTILLAPLVPCTARMAVIAFLAPAFFGRGAALVTWVLVMVNLLLLVALGILLNKLMFKGEHTAFIMEIPLYHVPNARSIGLYVWQNTIAFIKKAGVVIVVVSAIVWAFSWLPSGNVSESLLAAFGRWLEPFGRLFGLNDWRLIVSLFTSFIAKENTIATLGVLYGASDNGFNLSERIGDVLTPAAGLAFLLIQMLFIPCVATVAAIKQETASWKWTAFSVLLLLAVSLSVGAGVYQAARLLGWGV